MSLKICIVFPHPSRRVFLRKVVKTYFYGFLFLPSHTTLHTIAQVLPTPEFAKRQSNVIFAPPNSLTNEVYNTGF